MKTFILLYLLLSIHFSLIRSQYNIIDINDYSIEKLKITKHELDNQILLHSKSGYFQSQFKNASVQLVSHNVIRKVKNNENKIFRYNKFEMMNLLQNKVLTVLGDSTALQLFESIEIGK
jgi:hypothetical protein